MTDKQLAAYLEILLAQLMSIKTGLVQSLEGVELERHPETHKLDIPFYDAEAKPHPRAGQPVCLEELTTLIFSLRVTVRGLREPENNSSITDQYRASWNLMK